MTHSRTPAPSNSSTAPDHLPPAPKSHPEWFQSGDLTAAISEWVARTGYRLEMQTALALRRAGYQGVAQAQYYTEESTGEMHEVDVVGTAQCPVNEKDSIDVTLVIECKYLGGTPWVNLTSPANIDFVDSVLGGYRSAPLQNWLVTWPKELDQFLSMGMGDLGVNLGHRVIPYLPDREVLSAPAKLRPGGTRKSVPRESRKEEEPYWAIQGCLRAAAAKVESQTRASFPGRSDFEYVRPVVVVDGDLFECNLDRKGRLRCKSVDHTRVLRDTWRSASPKVIVEIVSADKFLKWVVQYAETYKAMLRELGRSFPERERTS
jgi:hypothetical protein